MGDVPDVSIGDYVRSFDFEHSRDLIGVEACYVEGLVEGFEFFNGCDRYRVKVTKIIMGGVAQVVPENHYVLPPVNGLIQSFSNELTQYVEVCNDC